MSDVVRAGCSDSLTKFDETDFVLVLAIEILVQVVEQGFFESESKLAPAADPRVDARSIGRAPSTG